MNILVTGGAGFIGSNFLHRFVPAHPEHRFVNVDSLTYAGNLSSLEAIASAPNYAFELGDIADRAIVAGVFRKHEIDAVVHFAAESHVDRSIAEPDAFIRTNVVGTFNLLEACRAAWGSQPNGRVFHQVSTDEVYGSLGAADRFTEHSPYRPSSPYSASKAAADHLVRSYGRTFALPVKITNCSNNYGPRQFPEKLVPLMILNAIEGKALPVYGDGRNVRDWLYVEDHCDAIWAVLERGRVGETYNVGGNCEMKNVDVVTAICRIIAQLTNTAPEALERLVTYVPDRPGHDFRYAIDGSKIETELAWRPKETFESGLSKTAAWYLENMSWVDGVRTGDYRRWISLNYGRRMAT